MWAALAVLVATSSALRWWAGARVPGPWFIPDEVVYAELGRSFYSLGHFEILGERAGFFGLVYPLFAGFPLHVAGVERGYDLLKPLQALAMSLTAVPVYLWGRSLVSRGWAFAAAALTLSVPGLALSGFVMTEVLFYPVFCLAAWAMARSLVSPTPAGQAIAVAAILLAALTRIQAVALAFAYVLAAVTDAALGGTWPRSVRKLLPSFAALAVVALAWIAVALAEHGSPLGAYDITAGSGYDALEGLRFVVYHAADLVLVTAVAPAVALILLVVERARSAEERAFVSVTVALTLVVVAEVGVFASRFSGRIAERNLFVLAPLLFLALVLWLDRGAPRRLPAIIGGIATVVVLLLATPWSRFLIPASEPDAFTLVPLVELRERHPDLGVTVLVVVVAVVALALLTLPRRALPVVALGVGILVVAASVWAGRFAASQARAYQAGMVGLDPRWIDKAAPGPVLFLYGGEYAWSGGGPVWANVFWNDRIAEVAELFGRRIAGPIEPVRGVVTGDGSVVLDATDVPTYVVASKRLRLVGSVLAESTTLALWQIEPPLRLAGVD